MGEIFSGIVHQQKILRKCSKYSEIVNDRESLVKSEIRKLKLSEKVVGKYKNSLKYRFGRLNAGISLGQSNLWGLLVQ